MDKNLIFTSGEFQKKMGKIMGVIAIMVKDSECFCSSKIPYTPEKHVFF
jgi:hypothetical protein